MGFRDFLREVTGWDEAVATRSASQGPAKVWDDDDLEGSASIEPSGFASISVVGSSNYQKALKWASAADKLGVGNRCAIALLEFEPTNKFDKRAIKVTVEGQLIGYIARGDQREVAPIVRKAIKSAGEATCIVHFVGGGEDLMVGARLDL